MPKSSRNAPTRIFVTSVRLTGEEHEALKTLAALDRRSMSNEIRVLIQQEFQARRAA